MTIKGIAFDDLAGLCAALVREGVGFTARPDGAGDTWSITFTGGC
jgi:hypothetical protein